MISMEEILRGKKLEEQTEEVQANLSKLLEKLNSVRSAYGKPMVITSGLRTREDQIRIYSARGVDDISKIPMGSKHISGEAVDFFDPKGELKAWIMKNLSIFEDLGIYFESFDATPNWVHMQMVAPKSGIRFFKP